MNLALLISLIGRSSLKKQIAAVLTAMALILSLPILAVFSLGTATVTFLSDTASAEAAATQGFYMGGPVEGNIYAWGNCTYWVFAMRLWAGSSIPTSWGNANTWDDRAMQDNYLVDHTPTVGAIYQTDAGEYGHVAYVTDVNGSTGQWTISEMNAKGFNIVSSRKYSKSSANSYNFIHTKKGASLWIPSPISLPLPTTGR